MKSLLNKAIKKSVYYKKKQVLVMTVGDSTTAKLFGIIGGKNVSINRTKVTVDVSKLKDVETALSMIEIVTEVK